MKLTTGVNFINVLSTPFSYKMLPPKYWQKSARKWLMKLMAGTKITTTSRRSGANPIKEIQS